jgi:hypothetical protein
MPEVDEVVSAWNSQLSSVKSLELTISQKKVANADFQDITKFLGKVALNDEEIQWAFKNAKRYMYVETISSTKAPLARPMVDPNADAKTRASQLRKQEQFDFAMKAWRSAKKARSGQEKIAEGSKGSPASRRTTQKRYVAFNGNLLRIRDGVGGSVHPANNLAKHQFELLYLTAVGMYMEDPTKPKEVNQANRQFLLPATLLEREYSRRLESIDGVECVRFDGTTTMTEPIHAEYKDSLWLDLRHGFMLRKRQMTSSDGTALVFTNSNPREVFPGWWLPMQSELAEFAGAAAPAALRERPLVTTSMSVERCEVNATSDELFELSFPTGTNILDYASARAFGAIDAKPITYTMPANPAELDEVIQRTLGVGRPSRYWWMIGVNAVLLVVILTVLLIRLRRSQRQGF